MSQSKYQRLAELAGVYAEAFMAHREQCKVNAYALLAAAQAYFEAPTLAFRLVPLDADLEVRRNHGDPPSLDLVQGRDGFWYFGLALRFEGSRRGYSEAVFTVGLKIDGEDLVVRTGGDQRLATGSGSWDQVLADIEKELVEHYQRPASEMPRPLGFTAR